MSIKGTVYVIEDDAVVRDSIRILLEIEGFRVIDFASAEEFLHRAPSDWHCCILTDIHMPGIGGLALIREVRRRSATVPIIAMTGAPNAAIRVAVNDADATLFIKPFPPKELVAAVRKALRRLLH